MKFKEGLPRNVVHLEDTYARWHEELEEYNIIYLYAQMGWGKTINVKCFGDMYFKDGIYVSAKDDDFLDCVEEYLDKEPDSKDNKGRLIIIDDLSWIKDSKDRDRLVEILCKRNYKKTRNCFILSGRAKLPAYLKPFFITKQLCIETYEALRFNTKNVDQYCEGEGVKLSSSAIEAIHDEAKGWPIVVTLYAHYLKDKDNSVRDTRDKILKDIYDIFDVSLIPNWSNKVKEFITIMIGFKKFSVKLAEYVSGFDNVESIIKEMMDIGSFLEYIPPDSYEFHFFLVPYFLLKQDKCYSQKQIQGIYEKAARYYEEEGDIASALSYYSKADNVDKIVELLKCSMDNYGGVILTKSVDEHLKYVDKKIIEESPELLSISAMVYSGKMEPEISEEYVKKLQRLLESVDSGDKRYKKAKENLNYLSIALPHRGISGMVKRVPALARYYLTSGTRMQKVSITGALPSMMNGGKDFCAWVKHDKLLYAALKKPLEELFGVQAAGLADTSIGESLYEKEKISQSMSYLTRGLSDAGLKHNMEIEFAATGVMVKVFISQGNMDTAERIVNNLLEKAYEARVAHIIPNIKALKARIMLYNGNISDAVEWSIKEDLDITKEFYLTDRYKFLVKARVYIAVGDDFKALAILAKLQQYAERYFRNYIYIETLLLQSVILYRRKEQWKPLFLEAVKKACSYGFVRVIADEGQPVLELFKDKNLTERDFAGNKIDKKFVNKVIASLRRQAELYPKYLCTGTSDLSFTDQELQVIKLIAKGMKNQEIAEEMGIKVSTVKFHTSKLFKKLQVSSRTMAIKKAIEKEII